MANLITGIDWIDHGLTPRREPREPAQEQGGGKSPDTEDKNDERVPLDERCWWLRKSRKRFKPFWWAGEPTW